MSAPDHSRTARLLEELLRRDLSPSALVIEDQSRLHAGHRAAGGGGHFLVTIRSRRFNGLSPLARQRLVLDSVRPLMDREVHALSLRCQPEAE